MSLRRNVGIWGQLHLLFKREGAIFLKKDNSSYHFLSAYEILC